MAKEDIICGLDVGTTNIKVIIAQKKRGAEKLAVVGIGEAPAAGLKKGGIVDVAEASESIKAAIENAERRSGYSVNTIFASFSSPSIGSRISKGVVAVSKADQEITHLDVSRALSTTEAISIPANKSIVHVVPKEFIIDGEGGIKDPIGMHGVRLEVNSIVIDCPTSVTKALEKCADILGLSLEDIALNTLAAARSVLSKRQKELGVMVLDIGGSTTGMSVFEEGSLVYTAVLPVGAAHITNDIAIGLRTEIDVAEKIKIEYGSATPDAINKKEMINLSELGFGDGGSVSKKHVAEIIQARLEEIFELAGKELKKISKQGLLPGGVVLVGGGSKIPQITELARDYMKLPAKVGVPGEGFDGIVDQIASPEYAVAAGLVLRASDAIDQGQDYSSRSGTHAVKGLFDKLMKAFKVFMP